MASAAQFRRLVQKCRDSIERILDSDTAAWSEGERRQQMLEVDRLEKMATEYESKAARLGGGNRVFRPTKIVGF